ncbi:MAG TPA: anhydro-N-acetylmuramic acid kinase [Pseudomonadales bacterium]|nr:anhydro-N-acetylmuramic acid kinase [Pseudomonadales bacterium]
MPPKPGHSDLYIGLMSGTSLDAIDAALVSFSDQHPPVLLHAVNHPIPETIRQTVEQLTQPGHNEINRLGGLDIKLGLLFADAVRSLLDQSNHKADEICAIGSHGQTIRHMPLGQEPFTLQAGDPNTIAFNTGITTVADFRRMDMAAGGQGAPLVPAFHDAVLRVGHENRAIVNIGGIANVTILADGEPVQGFDTGPGNVLLNSWIQKQRREPFDQDGAWAASGTCHEELLSTLLSHPFIDLPAPKSTGREDFHPAWLESVLSTQERIRAEDVQRTLAEFTARSIADAIAGLAIPVGRVLLCGGGSHNRLLRTRIEQLLPVQKHGSTTDFGIDADWLEAMAFAWLAKQRLDGRSGNIPCATGANRSCILGGIYSPH